MENEFKGTKEGWKVDGINIINASNGEIIAQAYDGLDTNISEMDMGLQKANAQLISKAPCMLNMLNNYLSDLRNIVPKSEARDNRIEEVEQLIIDATNI